MRGDKRVPLQWRNQRWQSLKEGAGKRCSECGILDLQQQAHTLSVAFRHHPPNSARFGYATLYLHAAVHRRGQRPLKGSGTNMTVEAI